MSKLLSAAEIEALARKRGLTNAQLCAQAGVAHSTFTRFRNGVTKPSIDVYQRLVNVVEVAAPQSLLPAAPVEQAAAS